MAASRPPRESTPPAADADGVRVVPVPRPARRAARWVVAAAVVGIVGVAVWSLRAPPSTVATGAGGGDAAAPATLPAAAPPPDASLALARPPPGGGTRPAPGADRNDLAAYFRPGDPEPTGAELIQALHETGIRTGIGAFNPPGTSPPLIGLVVPDGFVLPEGYVRHHQVTDGGEPIAPILMFAPGFRLLDAQGRPVAMPEDRVVTPELAPPGLPLRRVRIPGP